KDARGKYCFRTFERVQHVARDDRAFVRLDFPYLSAAGDEQEDALADRRQWERAMGAMARFAERVAKVPARGTDQTVSRPREEGSRPSGREQTEQDTGQKRAN